MIRVVTLDEYDPADVAAFCRLLFQAYGLGCEHGGDLPFPEEAAAKDVPGAYDASTLLEEAEAVKTFADDKLVYLTRRRLTQPEGPLGRPPTNGLAQFGGERAVVSSAAFADLEDHASPEAAEPFQKRLAKHGVHEVGALWELHTCLDARCSMHPTWAEGFASNTEPTLCPFCREKSENRIRMAKT